jgi:Sec-independent protein translocase protein TatA
MGIENPIHLLFIGAAALIFLGPRRLPDLAKALGHGIREFRESINLGEDADVHTPPPAAAATAQSAPPAPEPAATAPAESGQAATAQASPEAPAAPPQS